METNKNKKSVKFQGDMLNFCDFIQVFVFTRNHHLKVGLLSGTCCISAPDKKARRGNEDNFGIIIHMIP